VHGRGIRGQCQGMKGGYLWAVPGHGGAVFVGDAHGGVAPQDGGIVHMVPQGVDNLYSPNNIAISVSVGSS
jgi:hypothetical protein